MLIETDMSKGTTNITEYKAGVEERV